MSHTILGPAYVSISSYHVEGKRYRQVLSTGKQITENHADLLASIDLIMSTNMLGNVGPLGGPSVKKIPRQSVCQGV